MKKSFIGLTALVLIAPALPSAAADALDGQALFEKKCSTCHGTDRATSKQKTAEQWGKIVERMRSNGAKLTDEEAKAVAGYLAKTYGKE